MKQIIIDGSTPMIIRPLGRAVNNYNLLPPNRFTGKLKWQGMILSYCLFGLEKELCLASFYWEPWGVIARLGTKLAMEQSWAGVTFSDKIGAAFEIFENAEQAIYQIDNNNVTDIGKNNMKVAAISSDDSLHEFWTQPYRPISDEMLTNFKKQIISSVNAAKAFRADEKISTIQKCPDCNGTGIITLLYSTKPCRCRKI